MSTYPPTPAQMSFVNDLLAKRVVPAEIDSMIRTLLSTPDVTGRQVSSFIDTLKSFPTKQTSTLADYLKTFEGVEDSKYAIPTAYLRAGFPDLRVSGDLLFLEVKTYKGRRYLNRLTGNVGDFSRARFPLPMQAALLTFIKGRHVEFAQLFGQHFSVCGRCSAPLTDERSREVNLGPECRKVWGVA